MEGQLPASQGNSVKNSPVVEKLKQLCEDVETIKAERTVIESEIKNTNPNMRQVFLNANAKGSFSEAEMSTATLDGAFKSLIDQVSSFQNLREIIVFYLKNCDFNHKSQSDSLSYKSTDSFSESSKQKSESSSSLVSAVSGFSKFSSIVFLRIKISTAIS